MHYNLQNKNQSYRQKVIALVYDAASFYNRAVKLGDLQNYAKTVNKSSEFCGQTLTHAVARLVYTGDLYIAKQGRRDKYGGSFYLPIRITGDQYTENLPPSWLDIVWQAFQELWSYCKTKAKKEGGLPSPLITEEVENYILEQFGKDVFPADQSPVAYALAYLSKPKPEPVIKKLRRSSFGRVLWVPASVSSKEYSLGTQAKNKSESENIMVRDAVAKLGCPVTAGEISALAERSPEFKQYNRISFANLIDGTAFSRIRRVGLVAGQWYYYYGDISEEDCNAFIAVRRCRLEWSHCNAGKELKNLGFCKLTSLVFGRLMLIKQEAHRIINELQDVTNDKRINKRFYEDANDLLTEIKKVLAQVELQIPTVKVDKRNLPVKITQQTAMLSSQQLSKMLKPLLYKARKYEFDHKVADLFGRDLRRHVNPAYRPVFTGSCEINAVSRYLFDQFDALINAAHKVGGSLSRMLAAMVKVEMGNLRDSRFVMRMLDSENYEHRIRAAACLAFLRIPEHEDTLFQTVLNDPDSGVRKVALWSYAFRGGAKIKMLLGSIGRQEKNEQVLDLSKRLFEVSALSL